MIPNGLNPHGLENKILTFNIIENNSPVYTYTSNNRLYCWATFPLSIKQYIMETYQKSENEILLSTELADSQASWDELHKYSSKEQPNNDHYMVQSDQRFYYQIWAEHETANFITSYILDTSGSMTAPDYTKVKNAITGEIYDYNSFAFLPYKRCFIYSASTLSSMNVNDSVFGTLSFGDASPNEIWAEVSPFIDGIKRSSASETMITNLYYSIANMRKRLFYDGNIKPGKNCDITAITFILLTDESIFSSDTLSQVNYLYSHTAGEGKWYDEWFSTWRQTSNNKFPIIIDTHKSLCEKITQALKQMSYYYGVNFTWGIYGELATSQDKNEIRTVLPILNKCTYIPEEDDVIYEGNQAWNIPDNYHVENLHEPMYRISLFIPNEYIIQDCDALKDSIIMKYDDQFNEEDVLSHFHKDEVGEYSAFRFVKDPYSDAPIRLPSIDDMNINLIDDETMQPYQYIWELYGQRPLIESKTIECGELYNIDKDDIREDSFDRPVISLRLKLTQSPNTQGEEGT